MDTLIKEDIIKIINDFLVEEFEVDEEILQPQKNLKETLDLDSLDFVDLVAMIKSNFNIKLEKKDFENILTFHDFYNLIESKL